jgi:hypothetical protein
MKTKDTILLENAYSKILKEQDDKFQPNDSEMQELSKQDYSEFSDEKENIEDVSQTEPTNYQNFINNKVKTLEDNIINVIKKSIEEAKLNSQSDSEDVETDTIMNIVDGLQRFLNNSDLKYKILGT